MSSLPVAAEVRLIPGANLGLARAHERCCAIAASHDRSVAEWAEMLVEVRDRELWRIEQGCQSLREWIDLHCPGSRSTAYSTLQIADVKLALTEGGIADVTISTREARELAKLPPVEIPEAHVEAVARASQTGETVAAATRRVVAERVKPHEIDMEAETENYAERVAIQDQITDLEWLENMPLDSSLSGRPRRMFRACALVYRRFLEVRPKIKRAIHEVVRSSGRDAELMSYILTRPLKIPDPSEWIMCKPPEEGGCGGAGEIPMLGECSECRGRGWRIP